MDAGQAIVELRKLRLEALSGDIQRRGPEHQAWKAKVDVVMLGGLGPDSETLSKFRKIRYETYVFDTHHNETYFKARMQDAVGLIEAAIYELELDDGADQGSTVPPTGPIFVVHGRDGARKYELMRLLERTVDAEAVVLHEQANRGATLLEKLLRHAASARFAVVLLTADDEGRPQGSDSDMSPRGRQNVIFELGVFIGLLGRERVAVLRDPEVEEPSDITGLVYIELDRAGAWRHSLLKEIAAADVNVDYSRLP